MRAGNLLIVAGVILVGAGIAVRLAPSGIFSWFGHLPGDIRVEGERTSFFAPITSMIVISIVGSLVFSLVARLFRGE